MKTERQCTKEVRIKLSEQMTNLVETLVDFDCDRLLAMKMVEKIFDGITITEGYGGQAYLFLNNSDNYLNNKSNTSDNSDD